MDIEVEGFKAVWFLPGGRRIEYYPHINKLFYIMPLEGSTELLLCGIDLLVKTLGEPVWM